MPVNLRPPRYHNNSTRIPSHAVWPLRRHTSCHASRKYLRPSKGSSGSRSADFHSHWSILDPVLELTDRLATTVHFGSATTTGWNAANYTRDSRSTPLSFVFHLIASRLRARSLSDSYSILFLQLFRVSCHLASNFTEVRGKREGNVVFFLKF